MNGREFTYGFKLPITFYYGEDRSLGENEYDLDNSLYDGSWGSTQFKVNKVIFDKTFAEARPTTFSLHFFFFFIDFQDVIVKGHE